MKNESITPVLTLGEMQRRARLAALRTAAAVAAINNSSDSPEGASEIEDALGAAETAAERRRLTIGRSGSRSSAAEREETARFVEALEENFAELMLRNFTVVPPDPGQGAIERETTVLAGPTASADNETTENTAAERTPEIAGIEG